MEDDLPQEGPDRDVLIKRIMGSPDPMRLENGSEIEVTLCDYANPAIFFRPAVWGMRGTKALKI